MNMKIRSTLLLCLMRRVGSVILPERICLGIAQRGAQNR